MTKRQYNSKKEEIISKFREEFVKEYWNYDASFRVVVEMLMRDADPYTIIENLIIDRKRIIEASIKLVEHNAHPKPIYLTNEQFSSFIKTKEECDVMKLK